MSERTRRVRASLVTSSAGLTLIAVALASAQLALAADLSMHAATLLAASAAAAVLAGAGLGWTLARGVDALESTPEAAAELAARLPGAVTRGVTLVGGVFSALALAEVVRHGGGRPAVLATVTATLSFLSTLSVTAALTTRAAMRRRRLPTRTRARRPLDQRLALQTALCTLGAAGPAAALALGAGAPPLVVATSLALAVVIAAGAARAAGEAVRADVAEAAGLLAALGAPTAAAPPVPPLGPVREARALAHAAAQLADRVTQLRLTRRLALERAHEAERLRTQFLAATSHELRSPLHAVLGYTDLLLRGVDGPLAEGQRASLERIQASGGHLLNIVQEVLDLARIDAGKLDLVRMSAIPAELLEQSVEELKKRFPNLGFDVSTRLERGLPTLSVDQYRLVQALTYLLTHAVEALTAGAPADAAGAERKKRRVRLIVGARRVSLGERVACELSVWAPDATLPDDEHERLFDGFRLLTGRSGLGLGPHLARRFVELHGGTVSLAPPDQGVRFELLLPVGSAAGGHASPPAPAVVS